MIDDLPQLAEAEPIRWGFPDQRPVVASFTDLMTAALEAVMIQRELRAIKEAGACPSDLGFW